MGILRRKGHSAVLLLALVASSALVVGGWAGAQASARQTTAHHTRQGLTASQTQKLLTLIARARSEATAHNAETVNRTLSEFTAYVHSLQAAGSITAATSESLTLKARIAESQTAAQLETDTTPVADGAQQPTRTPAQAPTPQSLTSTSQAPPPATTTAPTATSQTVQSAIQSWWASATAPASSGSSAPAGYTNQQTGPGHSGYGHGYGRWGHGSGSHGHP